MTTNQQDPLWRQGPAQTLTVAGLFAGIGGFEAGFAASGHQTTMFCEQDAAAQAVLKERFPDVPLHSDIRDLQSLPEVDVLTCGFPCQDLSQAGQTAGIGGKRSGLVSNLFRLLGDARRPPSWIVVENVPFLLHLDHGRGMTLLTQAFEELGYRWAYRVVDAQALGLPQRRRRLLMLASTEEDPRPPLLGCEIETPTNTPGNAEDVACGFYWTEGRTGLGWAVNAVPPLKGGSGLGIPSLPAVRMPLGTAGPRFVVPGLGDAEEIQGFPRGWTSAAAADFGRSRCRLIGNAIPVPMAQWVADRLTSNRISSWESLSIRNDRWPAAAWGEPRQAPMGAACSQTPADTPTANLTDYLVDTSPLSARATAGFLNRAAAGSLRFPKGLLEELRVYAPPEASQARSAA